MLSDIPLISVIIPTYNRAHCLCNAIESVLSQTFGDYEIIVIDDGSTDNTKEVLQPYLCKITYIFQKNKGVSAARNTGIMASRGEWIAFLDSDDEWLPQKLELQLIDINDYSEAVLSCTNISFESEFDLSSIDYFKTCLFFSNDQTIFVAEPLTKLYASTPTVLARRTAIITAGLFDNDLTLYEDIDLFFRLSLLGGFVVNPTMLVRAFRRRELRDINLTNKALDDRIQNYTSLVKIFKKLLNNQLTANQRLLVQEKIGNSYYDLALVNHSMKKHTEARKMFINSFQSSPSIKNFFKMVLGLLGSMGIKLIKKRRIAKRGFRRSEYYQNV